MISPTCHSQYYLLLGRSLLIALCTASFGGCVLEDLDPSSKKPTGAETTSESSDITSETGVEPLMYFTSTSQTVTEDAGSITLTVKLNFAADGTASASYAITGTATNPDDHDLGSGTVTFPEGDTSEDISFSITDDSLDEASETIIVTLSSPSGAGLDSTNQAHTLTITDNDAAPTVNFSAASQSAGEASGTATITASLSTASGQDVTVPFTVSGTGTNPDDHDLAAGSISISAGSTTGNTSVTIVSDSLDEDDETVIATMGTPTNATAGGTNVHTLTITDDDAAPTANFSAASQTVTENVGSVTVTVTLSAASGLDATIPYTIGGTSVNPDDHDLSAGSVVISAGDTSNTRSFTVTDDSLDEASETATLTFGALTNCTAGATTVHTVTIDDNDSTPTVQFTATTQSAAESAGAITVTATLDTESGQDVTYPYTVSGTAANPADHDLSDGNISITAGNLTGTATINLQSDSMDEDDETIIVTGGSPTNATAGTNTTHTVTITDDDAAPTVSFSASTQNVAESVGTVTVTATPSATSGKVITVPFTISGTATNPDDHDEADGNISVSAEAASGSTNFTVTDDALDESDETVIITMGTPTNATQGATTVQTVTITDNDATPTVTFTSASQSSGESASNLTVTAQLSAASGQTVSVPFTMSGTATGSGTDYSVTTSPVTITAGDTTTTITITMVDDAVIEQDETAIVTMGSPTNATQGATTVHTATISENDQTITVDSTADLSDDDTSDDICATSTSVCTLRAAIEQSNSTTDTQTISVPSNAITLSGTQLNITDSVTITGTSETGTVINANNASRVISVTGGGTVSISTLTIQDGNVNGSGAGMQIDASTVSLSNVTLKSNSVASTSYDGAGIDVINSGSLTADDCTFDTNTGANRGGGINIEAGSISLTDSYFTANSALAAGALNIEAGATVTVERNLFYLNTGSNGPGTLGIWRSATFINNTLSQNTGTNTGGIFFSSSGGTLTLRNNMFKSNDATNAGGTGGIIAALGTVDLLMNIFDLNTKDTGATNDNCRATSGSFSSSGYNLSNMVAGECNLAGTGDIVSTSSDTSNLADNGGSTQTHLPDLDSPAVDAGTNTNCSSVDQRNLGRPVNSTCDIGPVEVQ